MKSLRRVAFAGMAKHLLTTDLAEPECMVVYDPSEVRFAVQSMGGTLRDFEEIEPVIAPIATKYLEEARKYIDMAVQSTVVEYMHQKERN